MQKLLAAVVRVGKGGRGFVVQYTDYIGVPKRAVITAAHCLPHLPPRRREEDSFTYRRILGPLGRRRPKVWAQCAFVDPIADLAVLTAVDGQSIPEEVGPFKELTSGPFFQVGPVSYQIRLTTFPVKLLSLDGNWIEGLATDDGRPLLCINDAVIQIGMSGSPILAGKKAVSLVTMGPNNLDGKALDESGPHPCLMRCLPRWFSPRRKRPSVNPHFFSSPTAHGPSSARRQTAPLSSSSATAS